MFLIFCWLENKIDVLIYWPLADPCHSTNVVCSVAGETCSGGVCKCGTSDSCENQATGAFCDSANNVCKCAQDVDACTSGETCTNGACGTARKRRSFGVIEDLTELIRRKREVRYRCNMTMTYGVLFYDIRSNEVSDHNNWNTIVSYFNNECIGNIKNFLKHCFVSKLRE